MRERTEVERAEKKRRAKEARENFKNLLEEAKLHGRLVYLGTIQKLTFVRIDSVVLSFYFVVPLSNILY